MFGVNPNDATIFVEDTPLSLPNSMKVEDANITYKTKLSVWYMTYNDIVKHQTPEGYWTEDVLAGLKLSASDVAAQLPSELSSLSEDTRMRVAVTWIAIFMLQQKFPETEPEWRLIAKKGMKYIQTQGHSYNSLKCWS